jgi:DNA (cytosine-5)-methyltransferase 1
MSLYQEIIFLDNFFKGKYCVENVIPFYEPLISGNKRGRHIYWTNFLLPSVLTNRKNPDLTRTPNIVDVLSVFHDYDFNKYKGKQSKQKMARNLVDYEAGKVILDIAMGIIRKQDEQQISLL